MGTEFNKQPEIFRSILDGLAGEPFEVVVTVGASGDPSALGPVGDNVRIERFVPQSTLLPHSAVFVSHGGSGALLGGLNAGVPMLAIPQGADQFLNAETIVEHGLGLRLLPDELSPRRYGTRSGGSSKSPLPRRRPVTSAFDRRDALARSGRSDLEAVLV